jgi:enoyl-CoA hydratase
VVHVERRGAVAILRMEQGKANALDAELCTDIRTALGEAAGSDAGAFVLTGTGSIFSAGVDLFKVVTGGREYLEAFLPALTDMLLELFEFERPIVCAVNGHAIAGGAIMCCASDYRVMANGNGRIGVPELLVGVPFPLLAIEIVRFAVPAHQLQTLIYTGRTCLPDDALARGLVDELVDADALLDRACVVAAQLAAIPGEVFSLTKKSLRRAATERIRSTADGTDAEVRRLWAADETRQAIQTYLQKAVGKGR